MQSPEFSFWNLLTDSARESLGVFDLNNQQYSQTHESLERLMPTKGALV